MTARADCVAQAVLEEFDKLPPKCKPKLRDNGLHEWVPLSGIVAERDGDYKCLALATGMKCLPASMVPQSRGAVLHDWHAEILAMRTFNRYVLDECRRLLDTDGGCELLESCERFGVPAGQMPRPFRIRKDIRLHMYCSEAPCGDASMELTMAAQSDATPWELPAPTSTIGEGNSLVGREFFSQLGVVRRKPGRGDAPPTLSKSCSDKIAMKECTSLLCGVTSLFVDPGNAYIDTLVVPRSQHTSDGFHRSFSADGRLRSLKGTRWHGGYSFTPFEVDVTDREFHHSRKSVSERTCKIAPSNMAATWSASRFQETIVGGVIQGRKVSDVRGASRASRRQMYLVARDLAGLLEPDFADTRVALMLETYGEVKQHEVMATRRQVTAEARSKALSGWVENRGDADFSIDT